MSAIADFLRKQPLFRCIPLSASITRQQCNLNRTRQTNTFTDVYEIAVCKGCAGLGDAVDFKMEVKEMAKKFCRIKGCTRQAQNGRDGMCKSHFSGRPSRKSLKPTADVAESVKAGAIAATPAEIAVDTIDELGWVQPIMLQGGVSVSEISNIDYIAFLRQLLDQRLDEWVVELNHAITPKQRAQFYISMCNAAEGLGY